MTMTEEQTENLESRNNATVEDEWMIRPCHVYDSEYSDCTSLRARFNQYFIFGKTLDCSQWKRDSLSCYRWIENKDLCAAKELVQSEKARRLERLLPHFQNDVWEKRKSPPVDWNKPLPEYLQKEYEATYLNIKSKEMRGELEPSFDPSFSFSCVIL